MPARIGNTYSAGSAVVAVTRDGGKSWTEVSRLPANPMGLSFVSNGTGYLIAAPQSPGTSQELRSTWAARPAGKPRGRFSTMPPPVT